jgi:hypothetical protein
MAWFKVDDNLAFHSKSMLAGNAAMGLWVRAGSWSAQQLTEGFVPLHMIASLGTRAQASALVKAKLWTEEPGGFRFWQWNDEGRQPRKEDVLAERAAARDRQRRARERAAQSRRDDNVTDGVTLGSVTVPPTRPDPTHSSAEAERAPARGARGTRLPKDWHPGDAEMAKAAAKSPALNVERELEKFRDWWAAASGAKGVKADWLATWRNWCRSGQERAEARGWKPQPAVVPEGEEWAFR